MLASWLFKKNIKLKSNYKLKRVRLYLKRKKNLFSQTEYFSIYNKDLKNWEEWMLTFPTLGAATFKPRIITMDFIKNIIKEIIWSQVVLAIFHPALVNIRKDNRWRSLTEKNQEEAKDWIKLIFKKRLRGIPKGIKVT